MCSATLYILRKLTLFRTVQLPQEPTQLSGTPIDYYMLTFIVFSALKKYEFIQITEPSRKLNKNIVNIMYYRSTLYIQFDIAMTFMYPDRLG